MPSSTTATGSNSKEKRPSISGGGNNIAVSCGGSGNGQNVTNITTATATSSIIAENSKLSNEPMKQTLVTIEHKIRNLEKRKTKLESYKAIQATGKELSSDQIAAVAKYDAVIATLEFARDLSKQMLQFCKDAEKEQKKQARKDNIARALAETAKIREVLIMQNVLSCFTDVAVRADFLSGENGAFKMETTDLDTMEKFCIDIQTRRPESREDAPFVTTAQKAAELFSMTIDARPKQYGDTTFEKLRGIFNQIQDCGYLDKIYLTPDQVSTENVVNDELLIVNDVDVETGSLPTGHNSIEEGIDKLHLASEQVGQPVLAGGEVGLQSEHQLIPDIQQQQPPILPPQPTQLLQGPLQPQPLIQVGAAPTAVFGAPQPQSGSTTPVHVLYTANQAQPQHVPPVAGGILAPPPQLVAAAQQRQMMSSPVGGAPAQATVQLPPNIPPIHGAPPPPQPSGAHFGPTTVRAVEQNYFKQHQNQHQQQQQQQQQQYIQQLRPLAEVISGGSFYFLQDSELDSPEVNANVPPPPVPGLVFEQQQPPSQLPPNTAQHPQSQLNNHAEELHQQQSIQTQTFTNQSFPPLPQQQQQQQQQPTTLAVGVSSTNTASPMFQPQQQQKQPLFSPVAGQQLLLQHDQRQQQPMLIMARMPPQQQAPVSLQQQQQQLQPQSIGMQAGDVIPLANPTAFPYENAVVSTLNYEQQLQQQLGLKASSSETEQAILKQTNDENSNDWNSRSSSDTNAAATAALTSVLKTPSKVSVETSTPTTKWSAEMNALNTPTTPNTSAVTVSGSAVSINSRTKNDWSSSNSSSREGGYAEAAGGAGSQQDTSNHWNPQQENSNGTGRRNSGNYQHRRSGGPGGSGPEDRDRGGRGGYRSRNYNNSGQQQNGRNGGNSGVYFRNNEPNPSSGGSGGGGSGGGGSSYYQNGVYSNKESRYESGGGGGGGGGNYRGPRGNQRSGNGPFGRPMGRNANNGTGGSGSTSSGGGSYMNSRQSNRLPLGLENKN